MSHLQALSTIPLPIGKPISFKKRGPKKGTTKRGLIYFFYLSQLDTEEPGEVYRSLKTYPTGDTETYVKSNQGFDITTERCGITTTVHNTLDEKSNKTIPQTISAQTPSGLTANMEFSKSYTETNDGLTEIATSSVTLNGKKAIGSINYLTGEIATTSPEGRVVTKIFDPETLLPVSSSISGLYTTSFEHDSRGRLSFVTTGERTTSYTYDDRGNVASVTDPKRRVTKYSYDLLDRVRVIEQPEGAAALSIKTAHGVTQPSVIPEVLSI